MKKKLEKKGINECWVEITQTTRKWRTLKRAQWVVDIERKNTKRNQSPEHIFPTTHDWKSKSGQFITYVSDYMGLQIP